MQFFIGEDGHPYYPDGSKFPNWDYSKPFNPAEWNKQAPIPTPAQAEVGEIELTESDKEALAKAEAKRARKLARK